jgi:quinone-modifying oxidoreductase subunit QmoC
MLQRQIKYQRDADPEWGRRVASLPGCERLLACSQCGSCSGACPLSIYMDITPRRILALAREGFRDDVLRSQTIWLCSCCYACATDCPQGIHITDVMFALKREAIENGYHPRRFAIPALAEEFDRSVRSSGRTPEFWLATRMAVRSGPAALLGTLRLAWKLRRRGRLVLRPRGIQRLARFQDAMRRAKGGP